MEKRLFSDSPRGDPSLYRLGEVINSGTLGTVYVATYLPTGQRVAIKRLPPTEEGRKIAYKEWTIANLVKGHSSFIQYFDFFEDRKGIYLVEVCLYNVYYT